MVGEQEGRYKPKQETAPGSSRRGWREHLVHCQTGTYHRGAPLERKVWLSPRIFQQTFSHLLLVFGGGGGERKDEEITAGGVSKGGEAHSGEMKAGVCVASAFRRNRSSPEMLETIKMRPFAV